MTACLLLLHTISTDDGALVVDVLRACLANKVCVNRIYDCVKLGQRLPISVQVEPP